MRKMDDEEWVRKEPNAASMHVTHVRGDYVILEETKGFLVWLKPEGERHRFIGVFSKLEDAKHAADIHEAMKARPI